MVVRYLPNATASEELYHHGVDDQKWGVRHGPPYPLDPSPAKQAIRKKKSVGLIQRFKNKRKGKKLREAKERKKKEREEIDKAVKAGNAAKVEKLQSKMSDEELYNAINRLNLSQSVATLKTAESMRRMEKGRAFLSTSANIATSAANIVESVSRAKSAIDKITGKDNSDEDSVLKALKKELDYSKTQNDMSKNVLDKLKNERLVKMLNDTNTSKETINNILGISKGGKGVSEERVRELIEELSHSDVDELYHYGVEGQKWGKRRYQNPDGSLTDAGRKHYGVGYRKDLKKNKVMERDDVKNIEANVLNDDEYKKIDEERIKTSDYVNKIKKEFHQPETNVKAVTDYLKDVEGLTPKTNLEDWNRRMWSMLQDDGDQGETFEYYLKKKGINSKSLNKKIDRDDDVEKIIEKYIPNEIKDINIKDLNGYKTTVGKDILQQMSNKLNSKYWYEGAVDYANLPTEWDWDFEVDENYNDVGPGKLKRRH